MKPRLKKRVAAYMVIDHMNRGEPTTAEDLLVELGMHRNPARYHLRELWALNLVHICEWDRQYQQWVPVYKWGNLPDKERPAAYTNAETRRRYMDKRRGPQAVHA